MGWVDDVPSQRNGALELALTLEFRAGSDLQYVIAGPPLPLHSSHARAALHSRPLRTRFPLRVRRGRGLSLGPAVLALA